MKLHTTIVEEFDLDWACADCALIWPFPGLPDEQPCEHCGGVLVDPRLVLVGLAA